jgi:hypothetical protein
LPKKKGAGGLKVMLGGFVESDPKVTVFFRGTGSSFVHLSVATSPWSHSRSTAANSTVSEE